MKNGLTLANGTSEMRFVCKGERKSETTSRISEIVNH